MSRIVQIVAATAVRGGDSDTGVESETTLYGLDDEGRLWWRGTNVYSGWWEPMPNPSLADSPTPTTSEAP